MPLMGTFTFYLRRRAQVKTRTVSIQLPNGQQVPITWFRFLSQAKTQTIFHFSENIFLKQMNWLKICSMTWSRFGQKWSMIVHRCDRILDQLYRELIENLFNDVIEIWSELINDCSPMWSNFGSIEKGINLGTNVFGTNVFLWQQQITLEYQRLICLSLHSNEQTKSLHHWLQTTTNHFRIPKTNLFVITLKRTNQIITSLITDNNKSL